MEKQEQNNESQQRETNKPKTKKKEKELKEVGEKRTNKHIDAKQPTNSRLNS